MQVLLLLFFQKVLHAFSLIIFLNHLILRNNYLVLKLPLQQRLALLMVHALLHQYHRCIYILYYNIYFHKMIFFRTLFYKKVFFLVFYQNLPTIFEHHFSHHFVTVLKFFHLDYLVIKFLLLH